MSLHSEGTWPISNLRISHSHYPQSYVYEDTSSEIYWTIDIILLLNKRFLIGFFSSTLLLMQIQQTVKASSNTAFQEHQMRASLEIACSIQFGCLKPNSKRTCLRQSGHTVLIKHYLWGASPHFAPIRRLLKLYDILQFGRILSGLSNDKEVISQQMLHSCNKMSASN